MKKILLGFAIILLLAIAGGMYYVLTNLNAIVEAAIEKYGSQAAHTAVRVERVDIKLKEGSGGIYGLTVANPSGFDFKNVFSLGEIKTGIKYESLKQEPYIISEVTVSAPRIFVEYNKDNKLNLNELKKNLQLPKADTKKSDAGSTQNASQPKLIIKKLVFENGDIQAKVVALNNKEYRLKMPAIRMNDIGGNNGAPPTALASEILDRLIEQVKQRVKQEGIDAEVAKLKAKAKQRVDEEKQKLEQKANEKLEQEKQKTTDKAKEKLKGLLGE